MTHWATSSLEEVRRLTTLALEKAGITTENTAAMTDIVARAEADGAHSHGLYRIRNLRVPAVS